MSVTEQAQPSTETDEQEDRAHEIEKRNWGLAMSRRGYGHVAQMGWDTRYDPLGWGPFTCREGFQSTGDFNTNDQQEIDETFAELRLEKLAFGYAKDPNVRYCIEVGRAILDDLDKRSALTRDEYDNLLNAIQYAAEDGAMFVARKWLRESECIPLLSR